MTLGPVLSDDTFLFSVLRLHYVLLLPADLRRIVLGRKGQRRLRRHAGRPFAPLRVSGRKDPARALVGTGIPHIGKRGHADYHAKLAAVTERTAGVRRWGAAALDLAFVAAGRFDAHFEFGLALGNIAAGVLLVREAGGFVGDIRAFDSLAMSMSSGALVCIR